MKILHVTTFLQGGAGRIICDLALSQQKRGCEVIVVASQTSEPGYGSYDEYISLLEEYKIPLVLVDSSFKRDWVLNLQFSAVVRNIIRDKQIDIIHAHSAVPALTGIIARSGLGKNVPVIQTMHGWGIKKTAEQEKNDLFIMNGLDRLVTVSHIDRDFLLKKGIDRERVVAIYNGITSELSNNLINPSITNEILNYKNMGYKIIGCIGTICERKNQVLLLNALKMIVMELKVFCVMIGEGDLISVLTDYLREKSLDGYVKFYGYQPNASGYIKYFDYLVLPSLNEGFGLAIVEAFRERTPVIASDIDIFKELIKNEKTGFLFQSNNAVSLKEVILKAMMYSNLKISNVVSNANRFFLDQFTLAYMTKNYYELYCELLEKVSLGDK